MAIKTTILPKDGQYIGFIEVEYDGFVSSYHATGSNRIAVMRQLSQLAKQFFNTVKD